MDYVGQINHKANSAPVWGAFRLKEYYMLDFVYDALRASTALLRTGLYYDTLLIVTVAGLVFLGLGIFRK